MSKQRPRFVHELRQRGHDVGFYKWPIELDGEGGEWGGGEYAVDRSGRRVKAIRSIELGQPVVTAKDVKPWVSIDEQLQFRYLLCMEGNSMATAIMWMLASNSLVIMPPPTQEGWALEGRLQPFVHYVPLSEPRHANRTLEWARAHERQVRSIIYNANDFVSAVVRRVPCQTVGAIGAGTTAEAWEWNEARDGPRVDAENMRTVLKCIMEPQLTKALFEHAAEALGSFESAPRAHVPLRAAALHAARRMSQSEAMSHLENQMRAQRRTEDMGR